MGIRHEACELIIAVSGGVMTVDAAEIAVDDLAHWLGQLRKTFRHLPQSLAISASEPLASRIRERIVDSNGPVREIGLEQALSSARSRENGSAFDLADIVCRFSHILVTISDTEALDPVAERWTGRVRHWCEASTIFEPELELGEPVAGPVYAINITEEIVARRKHLKTRKVPARLRSIMETEFEADFWLDLSKGSGALFEFNRLNRDLSRASDVGVEQSRVTLMPARIREAAELILKASAPARPEQNDLEKSQRLYGAAEWFAMKTQNQMVRPMHVLIASSLPLSVGLYEVVTKVGTGESWRLGVAFYLAVFLLALGISFFVRLSALKERAQDARVFAELLRISAWWKIAGVRSHLEPALSWCLPFRPIGLVLAVRALDLRTQLLPDAVHDDTEFARLEWVGPGRKEAQADTDDTHRHTQTVWYRVNAAAQLRSAERLVGLQYSVLVVATLIAAAAFASDGWVLESKFIRDIAVPMAVSVLPATAGAVAVLRERRAHLALAENYLRMARVAERTTALLKVADGPDNLHRRRLLIEQFGQAAIAESVDWLIVNRQRPVGPA